MARWRGASASLQPDAVYATKGGALQSFREARRLGIKTIYEQTSSYWYWVRDVLKQEAERSPELAGLLPNLADSAEHLQWKDEELSLADIVFVASEHVRRTLAGAVPEEMIRVVHYGAPADPPARTEVNRCCTATAHLVCRRAGAAQGNRLSAGCDRIGSVLKSNSRW